MEKERQRGPRKLKPFIYIHNEDIILNNGLDRMTGHGAIVLSVLIGRPEATLWNSEELGSAIAAHPFFRGSKQSVERISYFWKWKFKRLGLIKDAE